MESNYHVFRGKCKEACEALQKVIPELTLHRGWYNQPGWPKDSCHHWWLQSPEGNIVDPTMFQFPTPGLNNLYEEFNGIVECSECGKEMKEEDAHFAGRYPVCSNECYKSLVGL